MKIPTPEQIKKECGLPSNAQFIGWLVHNPNQDDFLIRYHLDGSAWCLMPDTAYRFESFQFASDVINQLDIANKAIVVIAFDLNNQVVVIAPEQYRNEFQSESNNPFRAQA
ncbi:hypothetical protein P3637_13240 [Vibrio parahaemolyticus]|nr:hypothetical protein [Vibrio parahaemolyticus]MDF5032279.1 hypothetical protein [Vibrio parahaemolyticus]